MRIYQVIYFLIPSILLKKLYLQETINVLLENNNAFDNLKEDKEFQEIIKNKYNIYFYLYF